MGQKVNPVGLRVGIIRSWSSNWYSAGSSYVEKLQEDLVLREFIKNKLKNAGVASVNIERATQRVRVTISTSRPGVVIGKKGAGADILKAELQKKTKSEVLLDVKEVRKPDTNPQLVAESIASQLERRTSWRRATKKAVYSVVRSGSRGVKVMVSGRLDGAEIARTEWYTEKSIPLHTLRADIDYGFAEAKTTYGIIGIKVWIYHGDVLTVKEVQEGGSHA